MKGMAEIRSVWSLELYDAFFIRFKWNYQTVRMKKTCSSCPKLLTLFLLKNTNQRVIEQFELEGTLKII